MCIPAMQIQHCLFCRGIFSFLGKEFTYLLFLASGPAQPPANFMPNTAPPFYYMINGQAMSQYQVRKKCSITQAIF